MRPRISALLSAALLTTSPAACVPLGSSSPEAGGRPPAGTPAPAQGRLAVEPSPAPSPAQPTQAPAPPTQAPAPPTQAPAPAEVRPWSPHPVVDLHVDTISRIDAEGLSGMDDPRLEAGFDDMERGGVGVVMEAVWVPSPRHVPDPWPYAQHMLGALHEQLARWPERWALLKDPADLPLIWGEGRIAAVLTLEGGHALRGASDLQLLREQGVRMVGLVWSYSNPLCGSSGDAPSPGAGLTALGREVVAECNRLGLAIDVSHASDRCLEEVLSLTRAPVIASHSNARGVMDVRRNLPDGLLQGIAASGGVVGVMFHAPFLSPGPADLSSVVEHVLYIAGLVGWEHVAIGSDFDGRIVTPAGLKTAADLPSLTQALAERGATPQQLDAFLGGNAVRYLEEVWDARQLR